MSTMDEIEQSFDPINYPEPGNDTLLADDLPGNSKRKDALDRPDKYVYLKLADIYKCFPLPNDKDTMLVNVYAIVKYYEVGKRKLIVWDSTSDEFEISTAHLNLVSKGLEPKPGQVVRIHRLELAKSFMCIARIVNNFVLFDAFKNDHFVKHYTAKSPTISSEDHERVFNLLELQAKRLLESRLIWRPLDVISDKFLSKDMEKRQLEKKDKDDYLDESHRYWLTDVALQVVGLTIKQNRVIIAGFNGQPFKDHPTHHSIYLNTLIKDIAYARKDEHNPYTEEVIRRLYENRLLTFIVAFGCHYQTIKELVVMPLDVLVFQNLLVLYDNFYVDCFSFLMTDAQFKGKSVQLAQPQSVIAKALKKQIDNFLVKWQSDNDLMFTQMLECLDDEQLIALDQSFEPTSSVVGMAEEVENSAILKKKQRVEEKQQNIIITEPMTMTTAVERILPNNEIECQHNTFLQIKHRNILFNYFFKSNENIENDLQLAPEVTPIRSFRSLTIPRPPNGQTLWRSGGIVRIYARLMHSLPPSKFLITNLGGLEDTMQELRNQFVIVRCESQKCTYRARIQEFLEDGYYRLEAGILQLNVERAKRELMVRPAEIDEEDWRQSKAALSQEFSMLASEDNEEIVEERKAIIGLVCPQCYLPRCQLKLNIILLLRDFDNEMLPVHLDNDFASRLFAMETKELQSCDQEVMTRIHSVLAYISHMTNDRSECSQKLSWLLEMVGEGEADGSLVVKDVRVLTKSQAC